MRQTTVIDAETAPGLRDAIVKTLLAEPGRNTIIVPNRLLREDLLRAYPDLIPANVVVSREAYYW